MSQSTSTGESASYSQRAVIGRGSSNGHSGVDGGCPADGCGAAAVDSQTAVGYGFDCRACTGVYNRVGISPRIKSPCPAKGSSRTQR